MLVAPGGAADSAFVKGGVDVLVPGQRLLGSGTVDNAVFAAVKGNAAFLANLDSGLPLFDKIFRAVSF